MIPPRDAWHRIEGHLEPLETERVDRRRAVGRTLSEGLRATVDVPPADVSAMDGYAVGDDATGSALPVAETVAAGDPPGLALPAGAAVRIMTGAPVPAGTDRVVPVELTDGGTETVRFAEPVAPGAHIRRRAEIVASGDPILPAGTLLTPGALALLATHGIDAVPVHRTPAVRVLITGDEVVPPEAAPEPGQLRDSHTDFLLGAGRGLGLEFEPGGIVADRAQDLETAIGAGLEADVLLLTGGVSMGEYDLVEGILGGFGCETLFDAVAIQPGKPLVVARHEGGLVFGLPGNPASVMVCFWLFVRPALRRLLGQADGYWHGALDGELGGPLPGAKGRDRFLPAEVETRAGKPRVLPAPSQGSHDLMAYARGTALVRIPARSPATEPGSPCQFLSLV